MTIDDEIDDSESLSSLGDPRSILPLQIKAINWLPADEIDACNDDLIVAITEVIAGHTIPTKNHLILPKNYLD
jgi:hypothetical protein